MKNKEIKLTEEKRKELLKFSETGKNSAKLIKRAKIVLLLDTSVSGKAVTFEEIMQRYDVSTTTITKVKNDFLASKDTDAFLQRKKRLTPPVEPKITGEVEARIIALACSDVPKGYAKWTLRLIAEKSVELRLVDSLSYESVRRLLKKRNLSLI
jgi:Trp operon repressor